MKKLIDSTFEATKKYMTQEGRLFRYSLSYCFLLALFPTLVIVVIMFQNNLLDMTKILSLMYQLIPQDFIEPFIDFLKEKDYNTFWSTMITLVVSMYMASNSLYSFMLITASHEKFKTYGILIRIKALVVFALCVLAGIGAGLFAHFMEVNIPVLTGISIFSILYLFYRSLSFVKRPLWYGLAGAVFSSLAIVIVSTLFFYSISVFTSYDTIYGPLASLAILLLSINVIAGIVYFGYCLNNAYNDECCEGVPFKSMWFFNFGNTLVKSIENIFKNG